MGRALQTGEGAPGVDGDGQTERIGRASIRVAHRTEEIGPDGPVSLGPVTWCARRLPAQRDIAGLRRLEQRQRPGARHGRRRRREAGRHDHRKAIAHAAALESDPVPVADLDHDRFAGADVGDRGDEDVGAGRCQQPGPAALARRLAVDLLRGLPFHDPADHLPAAHGHDHLVDRRALRQGEDVDPFQPGAGGVVEGLPHRDPGDQAVDLNRHVARQGRRLEHRIGPPGLEEQAGAQRVAVQQRRARRGRLRRPHREHQHDGEERRDEDAGRHAQGLLGHTGPVRERIAPRSTGILLPLIQNHGSTPCFFPAP